MPGKVAFTLTTAERNETVEVVMTLGPKRSGRLSCSPELEAVELERRIDGLLLVLADVVEANPNTLVAEIEWGDKVNSDA